MSISQILYNYFTVMDEALQTSNNKIYCMGSTIVLSVVLECVHCVQTIHAYAHSCD